MYNPALTQAHTIDVDYFPVHTITLSKDGLLPQQAVRQTNTEIAPQRHIFKHLPPANPTEHILRSIWINTHQAMFMSTGICADVVAKIVQYCGENRDVGEIADLVGLAVDCRHASAAYTSLPQLTKDLYEAYIRASMVLVHPGFSGVSNREAIALEDSLHKLKQTQTELGYSNRALARALSPMLDRIYAADRLWWKCHGVAMATLVAQPISLAKMDFKDRVARGSDDRSFDEYRSRVLKQESAMADYDDYFAVTRSQHLSIQDYREGLDAALVRSAPYVDAAGQLAEFRARGEQALHAVMNMASAQLTKS